MSPKYVGYQLAQWLSTTLPSHSAFRCAESLADCQWRWSAADRRAVQANLACLMRQAPTEQSRSVREVFRNFGRYLVEFFTMHAVAHPEVVVEGGEHLTAIRHHPRGAIVLTAHLGNWELGAMVLHRMGLSISAIALQHDDPHMDQLFNRQRQRCGIRVIPLGQDAARQGLQWLQGGHLLGVLGDRDFSGNGLMTRFCGRGVLLPRGPATLSLRAGAPILPVFLIREGCWQFRLCVEGPVWPPARATGEEALRVVTEAYAAVIERYVKRFPDQWLMFQPILGEG